MRHLLLPLLLVLLCSARPVLAQETQVPLDESGSLMVIDASVDEAEELFPDFPGFREARLFRVSEDAYVLEVLYESAGEVVRERRSLTPEEVSSLRARVADYLSLGEDATPDMRRTVFAEISAAQARVQALEPRFKAMVRQPDVLQHDLRRAHAVHAAATGTSGASSELGLPPPPADGDDTG